MSIVIIRARQIAGSRALIATYLSALMSLSDSSLRPLLLHGVFLSTPVGRATSESSLAPDTSSALPTTPSSPLWATQPNCWQHQRMNHTSTHSVGKQLVMFRLCDEAAARFIFALIHDRLLAASWATPGDISPPSTSPVSTSSDSNQRHFSGILPTGRRWRTNTTLSKRVSGSSLGTFPGARMKIAPS